MDWLRLYTEIRHDRKLRRLPSEQRWLWVCIMTIARESPHPGWLLYSEGVPVTKEDLTDEAAISIEDVEKGIESFVNQKMLKEIDGIFHVINWDKRQFSSDSSAERTRKYREKLKETSQERHENVTETPPETDTETDTENNNNNIPALFPDSTEQERMTLNNLQGINGYPFDYSKDLVFIRSVAVEFPSVDILEESKNYAIWTLDKPLRKNSNPRSQFRNWCKNSKKYNNQPGRASPSRETNADKLNRIFAELEEQNGQNAS